MSGRKEYKDKLTIKINNFIEKSNKPCLKGFRYFIRNMALTSAYEYITQVGNFLDYVEKNPEELTVDDYTFYLFGLEEKGRTASYQITAYSALKKFSTYLLAKEINTTDPMRFVDRPKFTETIATQEKREKGFLTKREIKELKNNILSGVGSGKARARQKNVTERDLAIIMIFLNTGMRCSALCNLDVSNIKNETKSLIFTDKGDKIRECPLSSETWKCLKDYISVRETFDPTSDALFVKTTGDRIGYGGVNKLVKKYTSTIKGKHITPHKLRATYGTQLYNATKDIYFVQQCMDHNNPKTTELYVRGQNKNAKKASEILEGIL